jgi:ribosomal-protein-alanine N-acetyltransferase
MIIREMTPQDARAVAAIEKEIFSQPWSEHGFLDSLSNPDTLFLVAQNDSSDYAGTCEAADPETGSGNGTGSGNEIGSGNGATMCSSREEKQSMPAQPAVAGYIGMYLAMDEGEITNVAVAASARKRGIGKALIRELVEKAARRGVSRIVLEVRVGNRPAIALYEQMGFRRIGTRKGFYDFPKEDADIMELHIG